MISIPTKVRLTHLNFKGEYYNIKEEKMIFIFKKLGDVFISFFLAVAGP